MIKITTPLVSVEWLKSNLEHVLVFDATLAPVGKSLSQEPITYIPGAQIFDFDKKICDLNSSLPHMMPSPDYFEKEARELGIRNDSLIVVYDRVGIYSAPRARWMLKAMGQHQVAILDGGLPAWLKAGLPTTALTSSKKEAGDFVAKPEPLFCDKLAVEKAINTKRTILDARSPGRFSGVDPEPRAGLRSGSIPTSKNLPFGDVLENGSLKSSKEINRRLANLHVSINEPLIFSCGSGVTACIIALAAEVVGAKDIRVYDGSWSEWGNSDA